MNGSSVNVISVIRLGHIYPLWVCCDNHIHLIHSLNRTHDPQVTASPGSPHLSGSMTARLEGDDHSSIILRASSPPHNDNHHTTRASQRTSHHGWSQHSRRKMSTNASQHHHYNHTQHHNRRPDHLPIPNKSNEDILRQLKRRYGMVQNKDDVFLDEDDRSLTLSDLRQRYESSST